MSYRTVAHHALTVYYDGDEALARKVLDGMTADALREAADEIRDHIGRKDYAHESARVKDLVAFGRAMADVIDPNLAAEGGGAP